MTLRVPYWSAAPEAMRLLKALSERLHEGRLEGTLVALIDLRVSQINGCAYCLDMHARALRAAGVAQQKLDCLAAWREAPGFSERERAALAWAEAVTAITDGHAPDPLFAELRRHFDQPEIVELTFAVATINAWNRVAISMRSSPEPRG